MSTKILAGTVLVLCGAGCAHSPPAVSADQAALDRLSPPPVKVAIRRLTGVARHEPNGSAYRSLRHRRLDLYRRPAARRGSLEADLAHSAAVLRSMRAAKGQAGQMPVPSVVIDEWERLLAKLDRHLDKPTDRMSPVQLVRAKVTVETELEQDAAAWRLPSSVIERVRSRVAYLDHRIRQARARLIPVPGGKTGEGLTWPVSPVVITSEFGHRDDPMTRRRRFHSGIDLDGYGGQLIVAAGSGVVSWSGWNGGYGQHVEVVHPGGWVTRYSHMSHRMVHRGDRIEAGDPIGLMGATGRATGPHLHFELWRHGEVLDPYDFLGDPPFTLTVIGGAVGGG